MLTPLLTPAPETSPAYRKPSHATASSSRPGRSNGAHPRTIPIQSTTRSLDAHIDRTLLFCLRLHPSEREGAAHPRPCTVIPACLRTQRTSRAEGAPLLPAGASSRIFRTCYLARSLHLAQTTTLPSSVFHYPTLIYTPRACLMRLPTTRSSRLLEALIARVPSPLRYASPMPGMLAARVTLTKPAHTLPYYVARLMRPGNCQGTDGQCR
jgi:hypothetical protein